RTDVRHRDVLVPDRGYDLQLMSWGGGSGVPTSGQDLAIVGTDNSGLLHIRTFDPAGVRTDTYEAMQGGTLHLVSAPASGNVLSDTPESNLTAAQAQAIADLKQNLPGWLPPHVLSAAQTIQVLSDATLIADFHGPDNNQRRRGQIGPISRGFC